MSVARPVTLCIVNYEGARHLPLALAAAASSGASFAEILVIDNASTDGSADWVRLHRPDVRVVRLDRNLGPAGARNAGFAAAAHDLILFQDNDVQLQRGCADVLANTLARAPEALLVAPRVLLASDPDRVQFDSADCHFLGLMITRNAGRPLKEAPSEVVATTSLVTACFLIDRARWSGGTPFDEWFGFNYEDHDFGVRASVRGHELLVAPAARVLHGSGTADLSYRAGGPVPTRRVFYLIRNRWSVVTKCYSLRSLLLLSPALLSYELLQLVGTARQGWTRQWFAAFGSWWRELPRLLRERHELQRARRRADRSILRDGPLPLTVAVTEGPLQRVAIGALERGVNGWWRLVYPML